MTAHVHSPGNNRNPPIHIEAGADWQDFLKGRLTHRDATSTVESSGGEIVRETRSSEAKRVVLTLPYPPTVNHYWGTGRKGNRYLLPAAKEFRADVWARTRSCAQFGDARLSVSIWATMPDLRKRDLDNIEKAIFDSLQHAGVYEEDSQIDKKRSERCGVEKPGRIVIEILEIVK